MLIITSKKLPTEGIIIKGINIYTDKEVDVSEELGKALLKKGFEEVKKKSSKKEE